MNISNNYDYYIEATMNQHKTPTNPLVTDDPNMR